MAMSNPFRKEDGKINPFAVVITVLLVVVIAIGGAIWGSVNRCFVLTNNATEAYTSARTSLETGTFDDAYASARKAVDSISALHKELETPQMGIASVLPVLGDDVRTAREMGSIAGKLADEAVTPVFDQWDVIMKTLTEEDGSSFPERAAAVIDELPKFGESLTHAKQVIYECEEQANSLPEARSAKLNEALGSLKETMNSISDMLRNFDSLAAALGSVDLLGGKIDIQGLISNLEDVDFPGLFESLGSLFGQSE